MSDGNDKLYDFVGRSADAGLVCNDPSLTVQSQAEESDINVIVRRFGITGELPEDARLPMYGDFTDIVDYRSALDAVIKADKEFGQIPAELRARFNNDPQMFIDFIDDRNNFSEAVRLGLLKEPETVTIVPVPGVPVNGVE